MIEYAQFYFTIIPRSVAGDKFEFLIEFSSKMRYNLVYYCDILRSPLFGAI